MCGRLPAIRNGRVDLSGTAVGSTATYSCDQGFLLVGEATRRCQLNGEWTGNEPFCRCTCLIITSCAKKSLQLLKTGFYSKLANYNTDHCSIRILACSYRMLVWGCMSDCHPYLVSMHFSSPFILYLFHARCLDDGHLPMRASYWCAVVECDQLRDIQNGRVVLTGTAVGSRASYTCSRGYLLVGDAVRNCQANGEWSGSEPVCKSKIQDNQI